ncbi:MAG: VWA domain-containing protein [Bacteroidetes bacterium]|nr:VWA domain-containing protein [Bacteroidota bacterium]
MLSFQHTEFLLSLALIPVLVILYIWVLRWKRKTIKKIGDERLVKEMTSNYAPHRFAIKFVLIVFAFVSAGIALANLRSPKGSEKVSRNGIDVMVALDVSKSMLADDIKPSRLERAKQVIGKLIDELGNDRIGIVVFAGKAYLQMPLTGDHGAAKMFLSTASPDIVPTQGTVIGDALKMCYLAFNTKEKKYKSVILISDGEDHDETAAKIAGQMAAEGVVIHTIGIGSPAGTTINDPATNEPKRDNEGNVVITKLNEAELKTIAEKGNGTYQLFTNTEDVVNTLDTELGKMDHRTVTEDALVNYKSYFQYLLLFSLLLLVLESLIPERIKPKQKIVKFNTATVKAIVFLIVLIPAFANAQNEKQLIKKGNDAYKKNEFDKAQEQYQKAAEKDPSNATAQFNLGNALYKNKKTTDATNAYNNAATHLTDKTEKANALYNKGVVLQNDKKLQECITAYKDALKLNPNDDDTRQNLQKAMQQLKQQQQQNNKQQKKPKENEKQKNKQKQKDDEQNNQPKPQQPKITRKDAEEKLKALLQQEKNLQDKLRKVNASSPNHPEKDW